MMRAKKSIGFLKTTAIGGLLFLLPLIVVGALIGQVLPIVMTIRDSLAEMLPGFVKTPVGIVVLFLLSIVVLLLICFVAGIVARRSFGRRLSRAFEKKLAMLFPRYAILKDQMADSIGGEQNRPRMKPVLVQLDELSRVGFETERDEKAGFVAVYMPGAPDPWIGFVALIPIDRVQSLPVEFGEASASCEQLGRGTSRLLAKSNRQNLFRG